jgi:hypothetical protein
LGKISKFATGFETLIARPHWPHRFRNPALSGSFANLPGACRSQVLPEGCGDAGASCISTLQPPPPVRSSLLPWISARGASNLCPCCACYSISPSSGLRRARATAFLGRWHLKADRFPKLQVACATMALYWCGRAFDPANINCFGPDELHGNPKGNFQMICWWPSLQELRS